MNENTKVQPKIDVLTGLRPSNNLTVANYLGAVKPVLDIQDQGKSMILFVADLHALTDKEPSIAKKYTFDIVADYLALGIDPQKVHIYRQSAIAEEVALLTLFLMRHITVAELLRVPTIKDKLKEGANEETANSLLANYPVMMTADIIIQKAKAVPVGKDQLPHLEVARLLSRRFNKQYSEVFYVPESMNLEPINILSLKGPQKMSKSIPETAIFLTDTPETVEAKIKKAETANISEMSESLASHILLAKSLASSPSQQTKVDEIIKAHMNGEGVMGDFKKLFTEIVNEFLSSFQTRRADITKDPAYVEEVLANGELFAQQNAIQTLNEVEEAMSK